MRLARPRVFISVLMSMLAMPAAYAQAPATAPATLSVRERLANAVAESKKLMAQAGGLPPDILKVMGLHNDVEADGAGPLTKGFPHEAEVAAYWVIRPWSAAYANRQSGPTTTPESWPTAADAPALRALLADQDAGIRSLAIEALAALDLPDDVGLISKQLDDQAQGTPVLGHTSPMGSGGWGSPSDGLVATRNWSERKVSIYAQEALRLMTGHRFDGKDPRDTTFAQWWKTNNLGKESLWYWQQRLNRESDTILYRNPGEGLTEFRQRLPQAIADPQVAVGKAAIKELRELSPEAEAKIFLMTQQGMGEMPVEGPVNSLIPDGIKLRISRERVLELFEGKNLWPDVADTPEMRRLLLYRLARLAGELLVKEDLSRVRAILERDAGGMRFMPVYVSRLLPVAGADKLDDPDTREGYLRRAMTLARDGFARDEIAREMVRSNLEVQWPVLEKLFQSDRTVLGETSDARIGIIRALGEAPHTPQKLVALVSLINDPRNETLFTQENNRMGMDGYRRYAVQALNAIAGKEYISFNILQDMGHSDSSKSAYAEFQRLATELQKNAAKK